jgi:hypothetical protein
MRGKGIVGEDGRGGAGWRDEAAVLMWRGRGILAESAFDGLRGLLQGLTVARDAGQGVAQGSEWASECNFCDQTHDGIYESKVAYTSVHKAFEFYPGKFHFDMGLRAIDDGCSHDQRLLC